MQALVWRAVGAALILILAGTAGAVPIEVGHIDDPQCDTLLVPQFVDELGLGPASGGPFPLDEEISAFTVTGTPLSPCPSTQGPDANLLVTMTNLTPFDSTEIWYSADITDKSISNFDGDASTLLFGIAGRAFRIDTVGVNTPLVFESFLPNRIFEAGETWEFIVQD